MPPPTPLAIAPAFEGCPLISMGVAVFEALIGEPETEGPERAGDYCAET